MQDDTNPWVEIAQNGLRRADQVENCKDWLTRRQAALDQMKKSCADRYPFRSPETNLWHWEMLETAQFRLDIDKWQLDQFRQSLEDETPN